MIDWFFDHYFGLAWPFTDPRAIPSLYEDYTGLPPALILTAGHDPLRDEGADYAKTLQAAGVPVEYACYEGTIHGFMNMGRVLRGAHGRARKRLADWLAARLHDAITEMLAASTSTPCVGRGNDDVRAGFASSEHGSVVRALLPLPLLAALLLAPIAAAVAEEQKDREFQECPECPVMVGLPAGSFVMGSPPQESGRFKNEGPQHLVSIKAFALGKYDITSKEFLTFLKDTGYQPAACNATLDMRWQSPGHGEAFPPFNAEPPRWPAVCLDRRDAMRYVTWLNAKVRLAHPEASPRDSGPYRLPSEAEWEYAARAGNHDCALVGRCARHGPCQLQWLREPMG